MAQLSNSEHELVALGAAIASNCVPCAEYHIAEARKSGLADSQIVEAVRLADKVRHVPAQKVLKVALALLNETEEAACAGSGEGPGRPASVGQKDHPCCR